MVDEPGPDEGRGKSNLPDHNAECRKGNARRVVLFLTGSENGRVNLKRCFLGSRGLDDRGVVWGDLRGNG